MKDTTPIWLDDEFQAPEGWLWVKDYFELCKLFETNQPVAISFDYYLANERINGLVCIQEAIYDNYYNETGFLDNCKIINFHSRDDYASKTQANFVNSAINDKLIKGMNLFTISREFFIEKLDSLNFGMYSDSIETN